MTAKRLKGWHCRSVVSGRIASPGRGGASASRQPHRQKYERSGTLATMAAEACVVSDSLASEAAARTTTFAPAVNRQHAPRERGAHEVEGDGGERRGKDGGAEPRGGGKEDADADGECAEQIREDPRGGGEEFEAGAGAELHLIFRATAAGASCTGSSGARQRSVV